MNQSKEKEWKEAAVSRLRPRRELPFACIRPPEDDDAGDDDAALLKKTREVIEKAGNTLTWLQRWGQPKTSWRNKCPYSRPRPEFLAKGLEYPPKKLEFENEEERHKFMRKARAPRKFMFGTLPTWSFMVANLGFFALVYWHDQGTI